MKRVPTDILSLITNSWVTLESKRAASGDIDDDPHVILPETSKELLPKVQKLLEHLKKDDNGDGTKMGLSGAMLDPFKNDIIVMAGLQLIIVFVSSIKPMLIAQKYNMGNIMNLIVRDAGRLLGGLKIIQDGFFPIFLILVNLAFVYTLLGVTAVYAGLFYFLMIVPMVFLIISNTKFTTSKNILSDSRGNLLREILKNIKNIKFCNIENYFSKSVFDNIAKDVIIGKKIYKISRLQMTFTKTISTFLTGLTFILYSVLGNTVSPAIIFPTYMYLDEICNQFDTLQKLSGSLLNTYESYQIMKDFLLAEERAVASQPSGDADVALELENVTWKWRDSKYVKMVHDRTLKQMRYISKVKLEKMEYTEDTNTFELQNLNVTIKKGSLVGIVGAVGAGKSTLFSGLVDELRNMSGKVTVNGEIAYFTQEPWIMSDDIKTNITFGRDVDFARLEQVIKACGMVKDLNAMKDGVYTKLGESGINLSGGQKARVALARCLYSDADIFLLDDPLAALDAYVGRQVFEHAIKRDLSGKTVLLATHQLQYMQQVDHIIVLDQGKVAESGSYEDLMGKNGVFSSLMAQFHTEDDASAASTVQETAELDAPLDKKPENVVEFVKKEKKETGNIPWSLYSKLFNGINTKVWFPIFGVLFVLNFAVDFLGLLVITWWADDNTRNAYYERLLLTTTIGRSVVFCEYPLTLDLLNIVWFLSGLDNYKFYFVQTFDSVVQAPLYFHEETPIGRILNRFGMDLTALDHGMNSFQRVIEYIKETPKEAAMELDSDPKDKTWPSRGVVEISRLCMAYHSKPEKNVISNLCISIKAGEKIGVVGRTGSGKSTLALAFFRILEPKSGSIVVDGRDITQLGLKTLRRSIDIIAQEANIFSGTIRYNLTLDCAFSDEELWKALELVGMKEYVSQLPEKLEHEVIGSGSNLSSGQGQLLCLARVLIKQPKLLILDEASSSIDGEADKLLQTVLRKTLKDTTIISIAHRLNTIADFDRVLVLDQGDMKEFDSPHVLLQDPSSAFSRLAESSGAANAAAIRDIARKAYQKIRMQE
ncbi:hypothetical protein HDV04_005316 [Boothiomyces sp. JEL0838]|nr:hypothetical protein HDV04_005316 [Boothiomyces sp. JEL0838]